MLQLAATVRDGAISIQRADGVGIESACNAGEAGFSATELLAASLTSCIAASLLPLLRRHGLDAGALHVRAAARGQAIAEGLLVTITLPGCSDNMLIRCRRAAEGCPVSRALNIPLEMQWNTE